jgi:DNA-directed RNA polymerase subunit RPC12/RpoP
MADLLEYKCPCCDGAITFDSSIQKMKCPYCDSEFEVETLKKYDESLKNAKPDDMKWDTESVEQWDDSEQEKMSVFACESCGGEILCDENTVATKCPYCDNPVVMKGRLSGSLKPDYVIPFKLDKEAAKTALKNHFKGKRLLPKVFKDENHIDEIKGVYVPFWLFDTGTNASIRFKGTKYRYWSIGSYDYTERKVYSILREGSVAFDNVAIDGSSQMPDDLMESIEPYDFKDAVDFQTAYLAGYLADKYDVTAEQSINRANERVKNSVEEIFRNTVKGYTEVTTENSSVQFTDGHFDYALYPVWLLNTTWHDKKYLFAMNGQTGKLVGDLPMDKGAFFKWLCILTAIFGVEML